MVHVSTAYANCDQETIEERIYPPQVDPEILSSSIGFVFSSIKLYNVLLSCFCINNYCFVLFLFLYLFFSFFVFFFSFASTVGWITTWSMH